MEEYNFVIYCRRDLKQLCLGGDTTVGTFRTLLSVEFDIPTKNQRFIGFNIDYVSDEEQLRNFLDEFRYIFMLRSSADDDSSGCLSELAALLYQFDVEKHITDEMAVKAFITELSLKGVILPPEAELPKGKVVILHLYTKDNTLSDLFIKKIVAEFDHLDWNNFSIFGWDISLSDCTESIWENLHPFGLKTLDVKEMLQKQQNALFFVTNDGENLITACTLRSSPFTTLTDINNVFSGASSLISELCQSPETPTEESIKQTPEEFQQFMYEQLGFKDYDCFDKQEHHLLKRKIAFAFYGAPETVPDNNKDDDLMFYSEKHRQFVDKAYTKICLYNNLYSKWPDKIIMNIVYNCTVPLKGDRTNISPYPVFVIRKCKYYKDKMDFTKSTCRIFIDHKLRVYYKWVDYLKKNHLPKCVMILPKDGRYSGNPDDHSVVLEKFLSPSCGAVKKFLYAADIGGTAATIGSGVIFGAALIPTITLAPVVLTGAVITGAAAGAYAIGRSSAVIHDKREHDEDLSFSDAEARAAYLNIVAGSVGFLSMGATTALAKLAASGRSIPQVGVAFVNGINIANIGASGFAVGNSIFDVIQRKVVEGEDPTFLTWVQLSSSILFFGNSVYNFRLATTIITESQATAIQGIAENLRSNNQRRTFSKLIKETIRQNGNEINGRAEVIATMKNVGNPQEIIANLQSSNKLFNKNGVRFSASNGDVHLNGVRVDVAEFSKLAQLERSQFLSELPQKPNPGVRNTTSNYNLTSSANNTIVNYAREFNLMDVLFFGVRLIGSTDSTKEKISSILHFFTQPVQRKLMQLSRDFAVELQKANINFVQISSEIDRKSEPILTIINCIIDFAELKVDDSPNFKYAVKTVRLVERVLMSIRWGTDYWIRELMKFFINWSSEKICETWEKRNKKAGRREEAETKLQVACNECQGYNYFQSK